LLSNKVLLSILEFSVLASVSPRTTAKLIASGELRSIPIGRRRLIARSEVTRFVMRDRATSKVRSALPKKGGR
jgi:excisionase family DNA binding protein